MDNDTLGDYWRDVKPILKQQAQEKRGVRMNREYIGILETENAELKQENKQLKMINKEYERLNKENGRGFTITNVQEYDIYELLSYKNYKNNWDKLKEYIKETKIKEFEKSYGKRYGKTFTQAEIIVCNIILDKMQELGQGSDSNENNQN